MAIDFTVPSGLGSVTVLDNVTSSNSVWNTTVDAWPLTQSGTSAKLVLGQSNLYGWSRHNLFVNSTSAPATQNVTSLITGATYTYGITGTGSLAGSIGASGTATSGSPVTFVASGTSGTFTVTGSVTSMWINRGPSQSLPYFATGAAAWYGVPIEYSSGFYGLVEPQATNLALYASDFTQAGAWTLSNVTAALTSTGPDGAASSASRVTATAGNGTALQAITSGNAARITSVFLKRITGTGNIDVTQDNGGTWATQTPTTAWQRFSIASVTSTNPTVGIRIVTSGDAVDVAWFDHELGSVATSPIPTFAATVTRAADRWNAPITAFPYSASAGTVLFTYTPYDLTGTYHYWNVDDLTAAERILTFSVGTPSLGFIVIDGNVIQANLVGGNMVANTTFKAGSAWAVNNVAFVKDGGAPATDATATLPTVTTLFLGTGEDPAINSLGRYKTFIYLPRRMTNAELQARTAA